MEIYQYLHMEIFANLQPEKKIMKIFKYLQTEIFANLQLEIKKKHGDLQISAYSEIFGNLLPR